ncbi:MAG TPA: hypothetical protein VE650_04910 [Acetobacteraceae bacterium]|nr:hypothetical protein [Acetobacteraceae bacterium]
MRPIVILAVLLLAAPAGAAEMKITQAAPPAVYKVEGRAIDVLGITPGMTAEQVRPILEKQYGAVQEQTDALGLNYRGTAVESQKYLVTLRARKDDDQIVVRFGTPATGNAVVEVSRQLAYPNGPAAPAVDAVRESLVKQYGPPSAQSSPVTSGALTLQDWAYKDNKPVRCANASCRISGSEGMGPQDLESFRRAVASGRQLLITATILSSTSDPKRAATTWIVVSDMQTKARTLEEGLKQLQAAASAENKRTSAAEGASEGEESPAPARPPRRR